MKLYNSMSRTKEMLAPPGDEVRIYSCGPTVYNYAHIGNLRTYVFMDQLRRGLKFNGFKLRHVMNITDVGHLVSDGDEGEDKMLKGARERGMTPWDIAAEYTEVFLGDIDKLNIQRPEIIPRATDNIEEMISFVALLMEKGYGYETSDGIYYDISKFPDYGKLSGISLEDQISGARVQVNPEKRHPADFALWKKAPPEHIMQWQSPWGMGYPGWHIECSALSRKFLGDRLDIHTGGVDHIPIHHENEIAQSEALLGHPFVDIWMHGEFMLVDGGKMSKSLGNTYTLRDLADRGYDPLEFRFFCLSAHYRSKLNFTWEGMQAAQVGYRRLLAAVKSHQNEAGGVDERELNAYREQFADAVCDDLNFPKALGVLWNIVRLPVKDDLIYRLALEFDEMLGLDLHRESEAQMDLDDEIQALVDARTEAKKAKQYAESDRIRDELKGLGIILEDTPQGVKWRKA